MHLKNCLPLSAIALVAALLSTGCSEGDAGDSLLTGDYPVAYVERPIPRDEDTALRLPDDLRDPGMFRPGARLLLKTTASPTAPVVDIAGRLFAPDERYDVRDVVASPDGEHLLFALRGPYIDGADEEDQPTWNIWEYDIGANALHRVISANIVAEEGHDIMPAWLADGRILFASTRARATKAVLVDEGKPQFTPRDDGRQDPAYALHVMAADGTDIHQISFNSGSDLYPTMLANGRVLFARQVRVGGQVATHLYTVRPDGQGIAPAFGGHSHDQVDGLQVQITHPRQLDGGRVLVLERPYATDQLGAALAMIDLDFSDQDQRLDLVTATGGIDREGYPGELQPAPEGRYADAVPLGDGTGRLLVSWSPCRVHAALDPLASPPAVPPKIEPCFGKNLASPLLQEADPLYGVFIYSPGGNTRMPVVVPREGMMFDSLAVAVPRATPVYIPDDRSGIELDSAWVEAGIGVLDIRSVYDFDGVFGALGSVFLSIDELMNPATTTATDRPARFLRLEKAVEIPDRDLVDLDAAAFGVTTAFGMRELLGYTPIEPDGSVRVKVTANVPFTFSVVDALGRRVGARHDAMIQLMPGEERVCSGCHATAPATTGRLPHGRGDSAITALNDGAAVGMPFPNTDPLLEVPLAGETMAQLHTRLDPSALTPSADLDYIDTWTDPALRTPDADYLLAYADLVTEIPASPACLDNWSGLCRSVIHYETHIQPLWSLDRGADTCTGCHTATSPANDPPNQLDLSATPSNVAGQFTAYRELLGNDRPELVYDPDAMALVEVQQPDVDIDGNPIMVTVLTAPPLVAGSAQASTGFFPLFAVGGSHAGRLSDAELRLIAEWTDIGAQYYNDPFAVPQ